MHDYLLKSYLWLYKLHPRCMKLGWCDNTPAKSVFTLNQSVQFRACPK